MGIKLGETGTVSFIDKKTGKIIFTQKIQTSDITHVRENKEINVKIEKENENNG